MAGLYAVPLLAALMWVFKEDVAPSMHAFNASFGIGMLLAPLLVSADVSANDTFHNAYIGCAIVAALISIPVVLLPSPHNPEAKQCCGDGAAGQTSEPAATGEEVASATAKGGGGSDGSGDGGSSNENKLFLLWLTVYIYGPCEVCAENVFGVWISSYMELTTLASPEVAPLFQTVYYLLFTISRFAAVPISARISSAMVIAIFLPLGLLGALGLILATSIESVGLAWVSVGLFGVAMGPIGVPAVMSLLAEYGIYPAATRMGVTMGVNMCGDVVGNYLIGLLYSSGTAGVKASIWVYVACCCIMVASALFLRFGVLPKLTSTAAATATAAEAAANAP